MTRYGWLALALTVLALGVTPTACLSDVAIAACVDQGTCGGAHASGAAGAGVASSGAATGGSAGVTISGGGTPSGGSTGGEGGSAADGGGPAGAGGAAGAGGGGPCLTCLVLPLTLPAPCGVTASYTTQLNVSGGTPPYSWSIVPTQPNWSINLDPTSPNGAKVDLSGTPGDTDATTVRVTGADGATFDKTYQILPRTSCWFAYTALGSAGPTLQLIDPILGTLPPASALTHNSGVYDFKFSPDGKFLAYRFGSDATYVTGKHLALLNLSTFAEQVLAFGEDAVTAYAWSADSRALAVAFVIAAGADSGVTTYLGGVKLDNTDQPVELIPTPALVDSDLYWVGSSNVAFHAAVLLSTAVPPTQLPNPTGQHTPFYAVLSANGFAPPVPFRNVPYHPDVTLQPSDNGFFMIAEVPSTNFYQLPNAKTARHEFVDLVAPSGHFTAARGDDDQLQIFGATLGNVIADPVYTSADGQSCPGLLAWAAGKERIACVADVTSDSSSVTHGEVRIFDIQPPSTLSMSAISGYCNKDPSLPIPPGCDAYDYDYTEESAAVQARAFSPTGRWFAFTTGSTDINGPNYLYWADVDSEPSTLKRKVYLENSGATSTSPTALAFSPDEHFLLLQRGNQLSIHDLTQGPNGQDVTDLVVSTALLGGSDAPADAICSEDFMATPERWCGSASRTLPFVWSSDPRYAAYRTPGNLMVADFSAFSSFTSQPLVAPDCGQSCGSQFAFQP